MPPDIEELSAEEFERDMDAHMSRILQRSVEILASRVIQSTAPPESLDRLSVQKYGTALAKEIAPVADLLLEALMAQDQEQWIEHLELDKVAEPIKALHMRRFNDLQSQLQDALAEDNAVHGVWKLTERLVCTEIFVDMVNAQAVEILKKVPGLDIEKPIRASQHPGKAHGKSPLGQPSKGAGGAMGKGSARTIMSNSSPTDDDLGFDDGPDAGDDLGFDDEGPSSSGPSKAPKQGEEEAFGESF
jgi:hypothetical protein